MRSTRGSRREPYHPKPIEKVELSEKNIPLRLALTILFLVIGVAGIGYGVSSLLEVPRGWQEIGAEAANITNCGEDFTLLYDLSGSRAEKRGLEALYSTGAVEAYQLFTADEEIEGVCNVWYLNAHPNEETEIAPGLYRAFETIQKSGDRTLYLGPVSEHYAGLFTCEMESQAAEFDPYRNEALAEEYARAAEFARDPEAVDLELLGENRVRLNVSQEYLTWAKENGAARFIDFYWMKNAFIADYLADLLLENGYDRGCLSSEDGFVRNFDRQSTAFTLPIWDGACPAGALEYTGPRSIAALRDHVLYESDCLRFYQYADGDSRTCYVDTADGKARAAIGDLVLYSGERGCAELLLEAIPIYVAEELDAERLRALPPDIFTVYIRERQIIADEPGAVIKDLYDDGSVKYTIGRPN